MRQFLDMWRRPIQELSASAAEIIVIDDASTDATANIVEAYSQTHPEVTVVRHENPQGVGAAMRTGFASSQHSVVVILCPDWAFQPSDLKALFEGLSGADVVAPVRPGGERPAWLRKFGAIARFLARWVLGMDFGPPTVWRGWGQFWHRLRYRTWFGLRLQDPSSGARVLRRSVLARCPIQSDGSFAFVEMYAKANFIGALFHEVQLKRPGTAPVLRNLPENKIGDQKQVFRSPTFQALT
jgi:glycosyltransferase involved in cell wall biosynthesis